MLESSSGYSSHIDGIKNLGDLVLSLGNIHGLVDITDAVAGEAVEVASLKQDTRGQRVAKSAEGGHFAASPVLVGEVANLQAVGGNLSVDPLKKGLLGGVTIA
jgi:hypothetical protein